MEEQQVKEGFQIHLQDNEALNLVVEHIKVEVLELEVVQQHLVLE